MKIKIDENIPTVLANILNKLGHEVYTVPQEGLVGQDAQIWKSAQEEGCFLITQDLDFSDIRRFIPGSRHGLLLIRLYNPSRSIILKRIQAIFESEQVESWDGCLIIVTENKIRIRYPKNLEKGSY